jgi:hypothetical protein
MNEDSNFRISISIVFRHHLQKPLENICKKDDENKTKHDADRNSKIGTFIH